MPWIKMGLAVRWALLRGAVLTDAVLTGADLTDADLRGADLTGADLRGADLTGADLTGADLTDADLTDAVLRGANLTGADLTGKKIESLVARVTRNDGYEFYLWRFQDDSHVIQAGCQTSDIPSYREHVRDSYPGRHNAHELTAETLAILDYFERRLSDCPAITPAAQVEAA
jgi:uncharacterized protein YjbI with pentapeptide repeats